MQNLPKLPEERRNQSILFARSLFQRSGWLILDTETTGFSSDAEICEIAILSSHNRPVLSTLVKPNKPIPDAAIAVHQITNEMVANAPSFAEIYPLLCKALNGQEVLIFNSDYDMRILGLCTQAAGVSAIAPGVIHCVMKTYKHFLGPGLSYKLPGGNHTALGDCCATYSLLRLLAVSPTT